MVYNIIRNKAHLQIISFYTIQFLNMNNYLKSKLKQKKHNFLYQKMLALEANVTTFLFQSLNERTKLLHQS